MDRRLRAWIERIVAIRRLTIAFLAFASSPQGTSRETALAMTTIRRLLRREHPVDFRQHEDILREMQDLTERLRRSDPITRMVRGTWETPARHQMNDRETHDAQSDA